MSVCQTGLMGAQRVQEQDEEGVADESATVKRKVSALAVRLVGTEGACETCKKAGSWPSAHTGPAQLGARAAQAEEAHRSNGELGGGGGHR